GRARQRVRRVGVGRGAGRHVASYFGGGGGPRRLGEGRRYREDGVAGERGGGRGGGGRQFQHQAGQQVVGGDRRQPLDGGDEGRDRHLAGGCVGAVARAGGDGGGTLGVLRHGRREANTGYHETEC